MTEGRVAAFAELLRELRTDAGLTQEDLAAAAGVSVRAISDLERGVNHSARKDTARLLADALRLSGQARAGFEAVARGRDRWPGERPMDAPHRSAATRTLPRDVASFTGRERELERLIADVAATGSSRVVEICAIAGMAGIGKSAFAVHAAHRLAAQFPDGQIFLPLHGHTPGQRPVEPFDALASLLQSTGVDAHHVPGDLEGRAGMWRDRLAGKRMLLLLDDSAGHDQIRPLLPGSTGCLVLVTSRRHLTALEDARLISLDVLPPADATALFTRLADRPDLDPADPAIDKVTKLCGHLPLAIGMLARQLHHHPAWNPAGLALTLATARDRLALMTAENLSVAAAFDLSYQDLDAGQQRMFRRLGLHPGPDFDAYVAAALDGSSLDATRSRLGALYDLHLVAEPAPGRYRFHDLIAEHARALATTDTADDCSQAIPRLLSYYLHTAARSGQHLARRTRSTEPVLSDQPVFDAPALASTADCVAWLHTERVNLHAAVVRAAADHPTYAVALSTAMHSYMRHHGPWDQALALDRIALEAARRLGDSDGEASVLTDIGDIQFLDDDYRAAEASLAQAIGLCRSTGNQLGQANALAILGYIQYVTGNIGAASTSLTSALNTMQILGELLGEAGTLAYLSHVQIAKGDYSSAIEGLTRAVEITSRIGHRVRNAGMINFLGNAQQAAGDYRAAITSQTQSLQLYRELSNPIGMANATRDLGIAQLAAGDYVSAATSLSQALQQQQTIAHRVAQAKTRRHLGALRAMTGDQSAAISEATHALHLYRSLGHKLGEAEALNDIGDMCLVRDEPEKARSAFEQALMIATSIAAPLEQGRAHEGTGRCQLLDGDQAAGSTSLRFALTIYQRIRSPNADRVQAIIDERD
jgi:tetratricopeptide (TPR) repeat protein/transcriptional regulator with XRE-family HTH domain